MLRRLFVGIALLAAFASLSSFARQPQAVQAGPANQTGSIYFVDHADDGPENAQVEFGKGEGTVWAIVDTGLGPGAHLSYILRLNGDDYKWGDINTGKNSAPGHFALPLFNKDGKGKGIPGGAYQLFIYDGDKEVARAGFGVKGGRGSDNDNDH